jgi:hypothetical protein
LLAGGFVAGGFCAGAEGAQGDLGGVEELARFGRGEDLDDEAVGDAGDEGVDGVGVGEEIGHGVAVGEVDAVPGLIAQAGVGGVFDFAGVVVGLDATADGGVGGGHGGSFPGLGGEKQIPFGNDRKKGKSRSKGRSRSKSKCGAGFVVSQVSEARPGAPNSVGELSPRSPKVRVVVDLGKRKGPPDLRAGGPGFSD